MSYSPPFRTSTTAGRAMDKMLAEDWKEIEAKEGVLTAEETPAQRKQEDKYRNAHKHQPKGDVP
ncbi:hypothetical protein BDY17DRAFT_328511 [Neohortaea acidophila]|uniref:Uncharacterized protein n=1 Tax=Neohortaea acidophila TaxID=245834 RepID=A0A6A6PFB0_9PEZI|nr:uncharacterized protein BDY17DRAFT_328511 [Neohortaea acidophila]KAF2478456.1 hypothetical protein BDY17DRAFT_328511 [Neohortaea acidophila]